MKEEKRQDCCEVGSRKNYWPTCVGATVLHNQHQLKSAYRALRLSSISSTTTLKHHLSPRPSARYITQAGWEEWLYTEMKCQIIPNFWMVVIIFTLQAHCVMQNCIFLNLSN